MSVGKLNRYVQKNETTFSHHARAQIQNRLKTDVRPETVKILEENIGSKILDIAPSYILSDFLSQVRERKEKQMGAISN